MKTLLFGLCIAAALAFNAHASDTCENGTPKEALENATKMDLTSVVFAGLDKTDEGTKALYQKLRDVISGGNDNGRIAQFDELIIFKAKDGSYSGIAFKDNCGVAGGGLSEAAYNSMKLLAEGS